MRPRGFRWLMGCHRFRTRYGGRDNNYPREFDASRRTKAVPQGLKALIISGFYGTVENHLTPWFSSPWVSRRLMGTRLKPCPDTKHQSGDFREMLGIFQPSLRDCSSLRILPRTTSWAKVNVPAGLSANGQS
jgi:hypothetical protein